MEKTYVEDSKKGSTALSFGVGFVVGCCIGAATAVMMAPQSGADTRRQIVDKTKDATEGIRDKAVEFTQSAKDLAGDVKEDVNEWALRTKSRLGHMIKKGKDADEPVSVNIN